jgi:hypothetical protein
VSAWRNKVFNRVWFDGTRSAGKCMLRYGLGRYSMYHPGAPAGQSYCDVCGRVVFRGMGRWWE